jgi:membrane-associated phospholipid phosphatase
MVAILLMYSTGLIKSLELRERSDRIGPLMCTSIAYIWLFLNIKTHNTIPLVFSNFVLGAIIAMFLAFFINNFSKISLHAVALGGFFFAFLYLIYSYGRPYTHISIGSDTVFTVHNIILLASIMIAIGAVLTSRLYLKAHNVQDVFGGFVVGLISQVLAAIFFL